MLARLFLLIALCAGSASAFNVAPLRRSLTRPARTYQHPFMGSKEDKEFEEWARQKKIASGVDPDEDFGAGRRFESAIYLVGGVIAISVPLFGGIWAYNEGYLTPQ